MNIKHKVTTAIVCSVTALLTVVFQMDDHLSVSENGLRHIANEEGCRLKAYQCSADKWTIGAGHTQNVNANDQITIEQAAEFFVEDVKKAETQVKALLKQKATQGELDMMVSFVFNLGIGNFKRSTLLRHFNLGEKTKACNEYPRWVYVNGQDCRLEGSNCRGIVKRRELERNICLNGWN